MKLKRDRVVIIGAGLTGLSSSYFLKKHGLKSVVIEKESYIGGLCSSIKVGKFTFERVQHFIHLRDKKIRSFIEMELKIPLNRYKRKAFIFCKKKYIPYPFQANLFALPFKERLECLITFIIAKLFNLKNKESNDYNSYYEWCQKSLGKGISKYFMIPYNEKNWGISSKQLTTKWMGKLVPYPNVKEILLGSIKNHGGKFGYNTIFFYPKNGSIELISKKLALANIKKRQKVTNVNFKTRTIRTNSGNTYSYNILVNTIPLPIFVSLIDNCPEPIKKSASLLRSTGVYILNIGFKTNEFIRGLNWCYFPGKEFDFYRIGISSNTSSKLSPKRFSSCYIEFNEKIFKNNSENEIFVKTVNQLIQLGFLKKKEDIVCKRLTHIPYAYVLFDEDYEMATLKIRSYLQKRGVYSIGRFGRWEYSYIEKNIKDAKKISQVIKDKVSGFNRTNL